MSLPKRKRDAEYSYDEQEGSNSKSEKKEKSGQGSQVQTENVSNTNHVENILAQARQTGLLPSSGNGVWGLHSSNARKQGTSSNQGGVSGPLQLPALSGYSEPRRQKNQRNNIRTDPKRRKIDTSVKNTSHRAKYVQNKRRPAIPSRPGLKRQGLGAVNDDYVENFVSDALAHQSAPSQMTLPKFNTIDKGTEYPPPLPPIHDKKLEQQCFTHTSYVHDPEAKVKELSSQHYERLEFLGDSYMNYCVTKILYHRLPDLREGELTRFRSQIVSNENIRQYAIMYGFNDRMLLGLGAEKDDVRDVGKRVADVFEAYIGGIITDQPETGEQTVLEWMRKVITPQVEEAVRIVSELNDLNKNAKQELYVLIDAERLPAPVYVVTKEGDTNRDFEVACLVQGKEVARGVGKNKNEAGARAAMAVLEKLKAAILRRTEEAATKKAETEEKKKRSETDGGEDVVADGEEETAAGLASPEKTATKRQKKMVKKKRSELLLKDILGQDNDTDNLTVEPSSQEVKGDLSEGEIVVSTSETHET